MLGDHAHRVLLRAFAFIARGSTLGEHKEPRGLDVVDLDFVFPADNDKNNVPCDVFVRCVVLGMRFRIRDLAMEIQLRLCPLGVCHTVGEVCREEGASWLKEICGFFDNLKCNMNIRC